MNRSTSGRHFMVLRRITRCRAAILLAIVALMGSSVFSPIVYGCPFCSAVTNTFSEDIAGMDAVIIGRMAHSSGAQRSATTSAASFAIDRILKGKELLGGTETISTPYFGDAQKGDSF